MKTEGFLHFKFLIHVLYWDCFKLIHNPTAPVKDPNNKKHKPEVTVWLLFTMHTWFSLDERFLTLQVEDALAWGLFSYGKLVSSNKAFISVWSNT